MLQGREYKVLLTQPRSSESSWIVTEGCVQLSWKKMQKMHSRWKELVKSGKMEKHINRKPKLCRGTVLFLPEEVWCLETLGERKVG